MWIKIITTKKYDEMVKELDAQRKQIEDLRGAHLNLHELHKGLYNKGLTEKSELETAISERDREIEDLKKKLRKAEHEKSEAFKKLKKFVDPDRANVI